MQLQFLGTGAGQPSKARNVSSLVLKLLEEINEVWMFDCGEGTQHQILETTIKPRKISKIFITHLHGDHIFGLPGFLSSRSFQANEEQTDLEIYGPKTLSCLACACLALVCLIGLIFMSLMKTVWARFLKRTSSQFMRISWITQFSVWGIG